MDLSVKSLRQTSPERISIELSNGEEIKATLAMAAELRLYAGSWKRSAPPPPWPCARTGAWNC